jgi:hypothetical protein
MTKIQVTVSVDLGVDPVKAYFSPDDPPEAPIYFEMVGRFITLWGRAETIITSLVALGHNPKIGLPHEFQQFPRGFKRKLQFLDYCFDEFYQFNACKARYLLDRGHLFSVNEARDTMVHGYFWGFETRKGETVMKYDYTGAKGRGNRYYSLERIIDFMAIAGPTFMNLIFLQNEIQVAMQKASPDAQQPASSDSHLPPETE